jgi:hypothetical protein
MKDNGYRDLERNGDGNRTSCMDGVVDCSAAWGSRPGAGLDESLAWKGMCF